MMRKQFAQSCFTFADRKEISNRTQTLPPEKLSRALAIIFGDDEVTQKGKEFTVDFGRLEDAVCFQLAALIKEDDASARVGPSRRPPPAQGGRKRRNALEQAAGGSKKSRRIRRETAPNGHSEVESKSGDALLDALAGQRAAGRKMRRKRSNGVSGDALTPGLNAMPEALDDYSGRVEVWIDGEHDFLPGSVLARKGKRILVLFDHDKSVRWVSLRSKHTRWMRARGFSDITLPTGDDFYALKEKEQQRGHRVPMDFCRQALSTLLSLEASDPFVSFGDRGQRRSRRGPRRDGGIFRSLHAKVARGEYENAADFVCDTRGALAHMFRELSPDSDLGKMCLILKSVFEHSWKEALARAAVAPPPPPPPPDSKVSAANGGAVGAVGAEASAAKGAKTRFEELLPREEGGRGNGRGRVEPPPESASHKNLHANLDERIVGREIQVFWDGDSEWYRGRIKEYDPATSQHLIQYKDGKAEWIDLNTEPFSFAVEDEKATNPVLLLQRLGSIVAAKAAASPWWPAEVCLPCVDALAELDDVSVADKRAGRPSEAKLMVLYFGEDQYDVLPKEKIKMLDPVEPRRGFKSRGKDDALDAAWGLAAKRARYLGYPPWKVY
eukprot:scaffold874_cov233-Pinguiococcus_pyrenoidosus.AAC.3